MEILKNTIRVERARHKMTQRELSVEVNCSLGTIHAIETGKFNPSIFLAIKISEYFGLMVNDMFTVEEETI